MRKLFKWSRDMTDAFINAMELKAVEIRTGITLIEAVEFEAFEAQLEALGLDAAQRREARESMALLAVCGVNQGQAKILAKIVSKGRLGIEDIVQLQDTLPLSGIGPMTSEDIARLRKLGDSRG